MRAVFTYSDLKNLKDAPFYPEIQDCIQIGVSSRFNQRMLDEHYFSHVVSFNRVLSAIDPNWKGDECRVLDLSLMSKHMRRLAESTDDEAERLWVRGYSKQLFSVWSAITLLEEAGVTPDDVSGNRDIMMMRELWSDLIEKDREFMAFRSRMNAPGAAIRMRNLLSDVMEGRPCNRVVVHGLYFITPVQERLMRMMESAGYEVVMLFPYDREYAYANQIWDLEYCSSNGYPDRSGWSMHGSATHNAFGDILNGDAPSPCVLNLKEFGNIMEFVRGMEHVSRHGTALYSPNQTLANEILGDFFPERYGKRTLMSYPIGGFIDSLHRMWNSEKQSLIIDEDSIYDCFASGWIRCEGRSSNEFLSDFMDIMPFFKGCRTIEEWNKRLTLLHEIDHDIVPRFKTKSDNASVARWEDVMRNPFSNFSMFNVDLQNLDMVMRFIGKLLDYAVVLFGSKQGRYISEHVELLIGYIDENRSDSESTQKEYDAVMSVMDRIKTSRFEGKFLPDDLANAIGLYLNNEFSDVNDEKESAEDWVQPMFDMDSNVCEHVHICLGDMKSLPGSIKPYVWPITPELIDSLDRLQNETDPHPLIRNVRFITETAPVANRYLTYSAFRRTEVTLSWITDINEKLYTPSPYIDLLSDAMNVRIDADSRRRCTKAEITEIPPASQSITALAPHELEMVPEARMECSICTERYLYSYILQKNPTFRSEFLQEFGIGGLISALNELQKEAGFDREAIRENVFSLFPGLRDIEKRNIVDRSAGSREGKAFFYNGRMYTDHRLDVHFPAPLRSVIADNMETYDDTMPISIEQEHRYEECMYCPHKSYCPKSKFQEKDH